MAGNEASFHVGIDLGTTNTVVASGNRSRNGIIRSRVRAISQKISPTMTDMLDNLPSVLFMDPKGGVIVGKYAKDKKEDGASSKVLYNTKIDMGQKTAYDNGYTPVTAAEEILKVCHAGIRAFTPRDQAFPGVTITVPASFTQSQIADTLEAARLAGFNRNEIEILEEPVAALYNYINGQAGEGEVDFTTKKRVMVYDIGGGTCDVCVVDVEIDEDETYNIEFVVTNRYTEFGGNDFDEAAAIGILNRLFLEYDIKDPNAESSDVKNDLITRLLPYCEHCKKWFSQQLRINGYQNITDAQESDLPDFFGHEHVPLRLSFSDYQEFTKVFFQDNYTHPSRDLTDRMRDKNIIKPVYQIYEKLKREGEAPIDCVFLTGGMSEYLPIEDALREFCKVPIIKTEEPMKAVALGAAMSSYIVANKKSTADMLDLQSENHEQEVHPQTDVLIDANSSHSRPRLPEAIFIDIENHLPLKIIDANISIPCKGEVNHQFKVGSSGVQFNLFAGVSEYDPEMRVLYTYSKAFDYLVRPNTIATIRYEINENRYLQLYLALQDEREQTYELNVDTTY